MFCRSCDILSKHDHIQLKLDRIGNFELSGFFLVYDSQRANTYGISFSHCIRYARYEYSYIII